MITENRRDQPESYAIALQDESLPAKACFGLRGTLPVHAEFGTPETVRKDQGVASRRPTYRISATRLPSEDRDLSHYGLPPELRSPLFQELRSSGCSWGNVVQSCTYCYTTNVTSQRVAQGGTSSDIRHPHR